MAFKCENELENFSFKDCQINEISFSEKDIIIEVEALIVLAENSQNTNYTNSYADITKIVLKDAKILSGFKEGFKYYDADDKLLSEEPDTDLNDSEIKELIKKSSGAYLFGIKKHPVDTDFEYAFGLEFADDSDYGSNVSDTYQLNISFSKATISWDKYLNRVQEF